MNRFLRFVGSRVPEPPAFFRRTGSSWRRWSHRATEPHILFPALAMLAVGLIWGTTLKLIAVERVAADSAATGSSYELAATYEAQVLRALREIDQALKVVKYTVETSGHATVLADLKEKGLLPPDLLFAVAVADADGNIVASSRESLKGNIKAHEYFDAQRVLDTFVVGVPRRRGDAGEWSVQFSRRLSGADGRFEGIVFISVDAAYFVSGYEPDKLGQHGLLGLLGTDGIYRSRRSGNDVTAGDTVDYARWMAAAGADGVASLRGATLDERDRFTTARKLYDIPLVVVVGLSRDEQFAATDHNAIVAMWRAAGGSAIVVALLMLLGRMSKQLAHERQRVIAEQAMHAERVEYLAYHDSLTALPNRSMFSRLLGQSIGQAKRHERRLAVLFLDLDRFKQINDTLGHDAGDQLLQEVALRLGTCLRASDTVARLGGDEFVALLPELDDQRYAATVAIKILSVLAEPFMLKGIEVRVTASIGISTYPSDGLDETTLTKNADIAMYKAKAEGKNNFQFYSAKVSPNTLERLSLESALRHAIEHGEFAIDYLPRRDPASGQVVALGTVLRWQHPERGAIGVSDFMPVAEETGLVVPIGEWMLRTICTQHAAWQRDGLPALVVTVRVNARQLFDEHFLPGLGNVLKVSGMQPSLLELAIGERPLMSDVQKAMRALTGLRDLDVRIAIEDFGAGHAALATLRPPSIDTIEIHRSLAPFVARDGDAGTLAAAVVAMARTLGRDVRSPDQRDSTSSTDTDELRSCVTDDAIPARCVLGRLQHNLPCESLERSEPATGR